MSKVDELTDVMAIEAIALVSQSWFEERGLEANGVLRQSEDYARRQNLAIPEWATEPGIVTAESGRACRFALDSMLTAEDEQVRSWARTAVDKVAGEKVQALDPISIAVGGLVLGALILASRVKKVGPDGIEFYEGIPKELANVLKAAANFFNIFKRGS